jgi:iron complex outermembrane recepter protein
MKSRLSAGVALFAVGAVLSTSQAMAQADAENTGMENTDIIVTATRREQTLQSTPLAVTAVSADSLSVRGISGLGDISNGTIPGMQLVPFSGTPSVLAVSARGVSISDPTQGTQELAVPIYVDGVPLGRAQGLGLDLIDPQRVEFLRGPQGQLFGRNAEGGAIQFVSRRPSGEIGFDVSAQYGNYNFNRERIRVDLPEFANIRLQFALVHSYHDGYTKNTPKGIYSKQADYGLLDSTGYRIAAEWNPSSNLRVNYTYDNSATEDSQPYLVWEPVDIIGRPPISPQPAGTDKYPSVVNSPTFNESFMTKASGHALTLEFAATDTVVLKSISSYREASRHGSSTLGDALVSGGSSTGILRSNAREDVDQNQWYQELQAIGTWERFNITVGATYFKEKVTDRRRSRITGPGLNPPALGISPASLAGCVGLETCMTSHSEQNAQSTSYGVYAQATYTPPILDDKLELTAGIRYSDDSKDAARTYIQPLALPPFTDATPSGVLPPPIHFEAKRWDPAFTVKYSFTDNLNAYVRYATAYRAGGANVRSSTFSSYDEESVKTWEVGVKSQLFDRRLTLNAAYYHNTITGFQNNIQEAPTTNPSLTNTANSTTPIKISGVEVEASFRVTSGLTLSAGYSYMHAKKFTEFNNPFTPANDPTRFYQVQAPEHAGNVAIDYSTPSYSFGKFAIHADYAFATDYWTTPGGLLVASLGPNYERPATRTNMLNGRVALKEIPLSGAKGEIAFWGKNLLQDTNYLYAFDGAASGGGFAEFLTPPRTFGVELRITY